MVRVTEVIDIPPKRIKGDKRSKKSGRFAKGNSGGGSYGTSARRRVLIEDELSKVITRKDAEAYARKLLHNALYEEHAFWQAELAWMQEFGNRTLGRAAVAETTHTEGPKTDARQIVSIIQNVFNLQNPETKQVPSTVVDAPPDEPAEPRSLLEDFSADHSRSVGDGDPGGAERSLPALSAEVGDGPEQPQGGGEGSPARVHLD